MIEITYYNDGKEKWQSYKISIREHDFYNAEADVCSHNLFDLIGYKVTKEETIKFDN